MTTKGDNVKDEIKPVRAWAAMMPNGEIDKNLQWTDDCYTLPRGAKWIEVLIVPASKSEESELHNKMVEYDKLWDEAKKLQSKLLSVTEANERMEEIINSLAEGSLIVNHYSRQWYAVYKDMNTIANGATPLEAIVALQSSTPPTPTE